MSSIGHNCMSVQAHTIFDSSRCMLTMVILNYSCGRQY